MNLSKQIQSRRKNLNLSQDSLAQKLFVSRQTISNWENGRSYPDVQNLLLLSTIFNVSLDELVKGDIEIMENKIANANMDKYSKRMIIFSVLAVLSIGPSSYLPGYWFFLPLLVLWSISMYAALKLEKIKKNTNIKTYKEIIAFMNNQDLDVVRKEQNKTIEFGRTMLIVIIYLISGGLLALLSIYLFKFFL
ncbi:helix-turn-helix domain-containing protein [Mammaliicoccus lentus]|uniref:helix-turn-helix domain-containing protein n=1 Tax=Mammaliicoccus lentus TaxID=42858 RepID=UPI002B25D96B|nr:helix-turn-helix transcriptional regulator [Mammaliicoccus lentus]WQK50531.1 helix-turn-helix transcriptional regulator [Mammaliicoccus lentus]